MKPWIWKYVSNFAYVNISIDFNKDLHTGELLTWIIAHKIGQSRLVNEIRVLNHFLIYIVLFDCQSAGYIYFL